MKINENALKLKCGGNEYGWNCEVEEIDGNI